MENKIKTQVAVIGSGPGGYSAAFRCADLGIDTVLIEQYSNLGGVCLNVGCIPSKSLLHIAKIIKEITTIKNQEIISGTFKINFEKIRTWKEKVVYKLTNGLANMAKLRHVRVINGYGKFVNANTLRVENGDNITLIDFDSAIIAAGSRPIQLSCLPKQDPRVWSSTDALSLNFIPQKMLIIGGGIIGLEIATIYHSFGSKIDLVEISHRIVPAADEDVGNILFKNIKSCVNIVLETSVTSVESKSDGLYVSMSGKDGSLRNEKYDVILVAIGRIPNGNLLDVDRAGVKVEKNGFINVNNQMRTNISNIYAIGDIIGYPMLAHKGTHEGHIAAEVIAGKNHFFTPKVIPCISYTEPELAWVGLTEQEAQSKGIKYKSVMFPWSALGRAVSSDYQNGITKLIFDEESRIIGGAVVGTNGGEIIGEIGLAIEMGCDAEDIALTIHAHPTLYESIGLTAEVYEGTVTDILI